MSTPYSPRLHMAFSGCTDVSRSRPLSTDAGRDRRRSDSRPKAGLSNRRPRRHSRRPTSSQSGRSRWCADRTCRAVRGGRPQSPRRSSQRRDCAERAGHSLLTPWASRQRAQWLQFACRSRRSDSTGRTLRLRQVNVRGDSRGTQAGVRGLRARRRSRPGLSGRARAPPSPPR